VRGHIDLGNTDEEIFAITKRCTEYRTGLRTNLSNIEFNSNKKQSVTYTDAKLICIDFLRR